VVGKAETNTVSGRQQIPRRLGDARLRHYHAHHVTRTVSPDRVQLRGAPPGVSETALTDPAVEEHENVPVDAPDEQAPPTGEQDEPGFELRRVAWGVTAVAFLVAALILVIGRRYGYSEVTFAVAVAAGINVF
jgi:hypothetical protein